MPYSPVLLLAEFCVLALRDENIQRVYNLHRHDKRCVYCRHFCEFVYCNLLKFPLIALMEIIVVVELNLTYVHCLSSSIRSIQSYGVVLKRLSIDGKEEKQEELLGQIIERESRVIEVEINLNINKVRVPYK